MSKSREQLVKYLSEIDITDKVVLDVGCGDKSKWARNFTKGEPKEYITNDIEKEFNVDDNSDFNLMNLSNNLDLLEGKINIIFCLETLEHLWNPIAGLSSFRWLLKEKGKLYLSTPLINPYHDTVDYARYTDEWYQKVLTEVGFKDIKIRPRVATDGLSYLLQFYKTEGLRMSKIRLKKGEQDKMAHIGYFVEAVK